MTRVVIEIRFHEDLANPFLNQMRYRMESCAWRKKWRQAEADGDFDKMDQLNTEYDLVGLP